ncbi:uncharacterized protein LOC115880252 [Sitophilus oryzae]|uniref:XK-related protein n=1 Tax=Sitophilus oryzae TaxID=7048 RepID=A0A6J2XQE7_SITOR|nr:uncharacterized protein LOC115880252 [Sitophilus oryzae]
MSTVTKNSNSNKPKTLLGYELTPTQNALVNFLLPSIGACVLYKFIIAVDVGVIFRHYKDNDPIWASLTIFIMYLPALSSYVIIMSDWDYWPEPDKGLTRNNVKWAFRQTLEHLFFPFWNMWRFAERIFWSIEAIRSKDEQSISKFTSLASAPRIIELYVFLQSYFHSLPQVLLQLYILMRHNANIARESKEVQFFSIVLNLAKVAVTTTYYQRFKAQKLTGAQYPWLKMNKIMRSKITTEQQDVLLRDSYRSRSVVETKRSSNISRLYRVEPATIAARRRSSDIYLEPIDVGVDEVDNRRNVTESTVVSETEVDYSGFSESRIVSVSSRSEPDFNISRIIYVKGLQEDDLAGKIVAFSWWFTFLLGRILAISVFAYFYMKACVWSVICHVIVIIAILVYDVKTDNIKRDKALFFIFLGFVYIFCIIEFKIRFKKAYFIYYGFFVLVFMENFVMCLIWYYTELESLENDYWFRYVFYITIACGMLSFSAMVFYLTLTKPKSVSIPVQVVNIN